MKKTWEKPEVMNLGVGETLCDDYDNGIIPSHGQDDPNGGPGNSGKIPCPYCNHSCPNQTTLDKHIEKVHFVGTTVPLS